MAASCSSAVVGIPEGRWISDNEDAKWLTMFPAEIWRAIVDSVSDPGVMYNMAKASPFLERFLESQRTLYLLYPVLKIHDLGHQSVGSQHRKPNLCDYLGTKELLKCRLVCSSWKSAVDHFLESRPHHSTVSVAAPVPISRRDSFFKIPVPNERMQDPAYGAYFRLQHFAKFPGWRETVLLLDMSSPFYVNNPTDHCPSPTRHLEIKEDSRPAWNWSKHNITKAQNCREYRENKKASDGGGGGEPPQHPRQDRNFDFVKMFLERVGASFHHLTIQADSYKTIQEYVELMPNLKSLYITARTNWEKVEMEDVGTYFPTLKNLNLLSLNGLPDPASKQIFDANPSAQIVEIFRYHPDLPPGQGKTGSCLVPWPANPVKVATTIKYTDELVGMPTAWKLNVLKLNFSWERFIDWGTIFRKVEFYRETLTELHLELPRPPNEAPIEWVLTSTWEASRSQLNLPNLKRLEVKAGKLCSLDFLLGLKSLEYLCLWLDYNVDEETKLVGWIQEETINFNRGYSARFMECNIWELMVDLKEVHLIPRYQPMQKYLKGMRIDDN